MLHALLPSQEGQLEALSLLRTTGPITNSPQIPPDQTRGSYLCHTYAPKSAVSIFYSEPTVLQALSKWQTGTSLTCRTGTPHMYSQQTRAEFASGSMQEAEGGNKDTHFFLCVCPGTALGAAAACATGTAWEAQLGTALPTLKCLRASRQKQSTQQLRCIPLSSQKVLPDHTTSKAVLQPTYKPSPWQGTRGTAEL